MKFIEQLYLYENYTTNPTQIMLSYVICIVRCDNWRQSSGWAGPQSWPLMDQYWRGDRWWRDNYLLTLYNPQSAQIILITADLGAFNLYLVRAGSDNWFLAHTKNSRYFKHPFCSNKWSYCSTEHPHHCKYYLSKYGPNIWKMREGWNSIHFQCFCLP